MKQPRTKGVLIGLAPENSAEYPTTYGTVATLCEFESFLQQTVSTLRSTVHYNLV
jgi:hypothetical protein